MGWMAPLRHRGAKLVFSNNHQEKEPSMSEITTIGLDLAKHVFQVHGIDAQGYDGSAQATAARASAGVLQPHSAVCGRVGSLCDGALLGSRAPSTKCG